MAEALHPGVGAHAALFRHLKVNAYKRGQFVGSAPLWSGKRWKTAVRVYQSGDDMVVRMYHTDILVASREGSFTLRAGGYASSPSTREAIRAALRLCGYNGWIYTDNRNGYKNQMVHLRGIRHVFYDGMQFDHTGGLITPARPVFKQVANRELRKQWHAAMNEAKQVFMGLCALGPSALDSGQYLRLPQDPMEWPNVPHDVLIPALLYKAAGWACSSYSVVDDWPKAAWASIARGVFEYHAFNMVVEDPSGP